MNEYANLGTYELRVAQLRRATAPARFVLEHLTGGGWDNLGGNIPIPVTQHIPTMWKNHFPLRVEDGSTTETPRV